MKVTHKPENANTGAPIDHGFSAIASLRDGRWKVDCCGMKQKKSRTTASRIDRFKKADNWTQRRIEEGFAVDACCVVANKRAIKGRRWNDLKKHVFRGVTFYSKPADQLTPGNIEKVFGYQRIDSHLYRKAVSFLEMVEQETMARGGMTDELHLCRVMLNSVIAKIPYHLQK